MSFPEDRAAGAQSEPVWPQSATSDPSHTLSNTLSNINEAPVVSPPTGVGESPAATRAIKILKSLRILQQEFWTLTSREKLPETKLTAELLRLRERLEFLTGLRASAGGWLAIMTDESDAVFGGLPEIGIEFALFLYDQVSSLLYDPDDPLRVYQDSPSSLWTSLRALEKEFLDVSSRARSDDESPDLAQHPKHRAAISNVRIKLQQLTGLDTGKKDWITVPTRTTREVFEHESRDTFHLANRLYTHLSFFISSYISETMMLAE